MSIENRVTLVWVSRLSDFRLRSHNKRPQRIDVTKMPPTDADNGPSNKVPRNNAGPGLIRADVDPNSSDHMVAMTQLKEKIASLQKQLNQKDAQLLSKDKLVGTLLTIVILFFDSFFLTAVFFYTIRFKQVFSRFLTNNQITHSNTLRHCKLLRVRIFNFLLPFE